MVAAGRAGAAARQKQLLEQLQVAKESLHPGEGKSAPPKETDRERTDKRPEHNRNWIPWFIAACLAGGSLAYISRNMRLRASPTSVEAGPAPKVQDNPLPIQGLLRPPQYGIRPCQPRLPTERCSLTRYTTTRSSLALLRDIPGLVNWRFGVALEASLYTLRCWHGRGARRSRHGD